MNGLSELAAGNGEGNGEEGRIGPVLPAGGVCLLTAGAVDAGKSTLQRSIIHRLFTDERIDFQLRNAEGEEHQDPRLQDWIFSTDRGEFPKRTQGMLETFFIEFGQRRKQVRLSFAEISGEDFERILPKSNGEEGGEGGDLRPEIEDILTTESVRKLLVFVADAKRYQTSGRRRNRTADGPEGTEKADVKQARYEDMLFATLLTRIRHLGLKRIRVLFVAAKWDEVKPRNLDPEQFFRRHFPQTRSILKRYEKAETQYIRFSVGTVEKDAEGNARAVMKIDPRPTERVIQWIYTESTGRRLKGYPAMRETWWEKVKRMASQ